MGTQVCKSCDIEKPINKFEWRKDRPNPRKVCQSCRDKQRDPEKRKLWTKQWRDKKEAADPGYLRRIYERSVYGACKEDFNYNECWICGDTGNLNIDHCHSSKKVRGLLCSHCNFALGHFKDSTKNMEKAIQYLKSDMPHFELG